MTGHWMWIGGLLVFVLGCGDVSVRPFAAEPNSGVAGADGSGGTVGDPDENNGNPGGGGPGGGDPGGGDPGGGEPDDMDADIDDMDADIDDDTDAILDPDVDNGGID